METIFQYKIFSVGDYAFTVTMVAGLFLTWLLSWLLLRALARVIRKGGRYLNVSDEGRRHSLFLLAQYVVWTVAIAIALEVIGIHVSVVLAGSAALLVGLGLGVQQIFRDIMSGIFLLFEGTIEVGDVLEIDGHIGKVLEISLRTSKLETREGWVMIVPNHKFITENLINWSHKDQLPTRFSVTVGADYQASESAVRDILVQCAREHAQIVSDAPYTPIIHLKKFSDERMIFELIFWTHQKFEADAIAGQLRFSIREKLREAGIPMAKA